MKNKKQLLSVIALGLVVALLLGVYIVTRPGGILGPKEITVTVVHKDGSEKEFVYHTDEEYLGPVLLSEGLVEGEQGPYGLYIKVVDGVTADFDVDQSYWSLYVGQEPAMQGADTTPIADGDSFRLVYTIG